MKKAAIYARTATAEQGNFDRIEHQVSECKLKIMDDGNKLEDECVYIDNGVSGSTLERVGMDKLRQDAKNHKFNVLYVQDYARLSRNIIDAMSLFKELNDSGVKIISLTQYDQFAFNIRCAVQRFVESSEQEEREKSAKK